MLSELWRAVKRAFKAEDADERTLLSSTANKRVDGERLVPRVDYTAPIEEICPSLQKNPDSSQKRL